MNDRVRITRHDNGVAEVCLARPDKLNALDLEMFDALVAAIDSLRADPGLRAVVLHGQGRAFCAGLDMGRMDRIASGAPGGVRDLRARTHGAMNAAQYAAVGWRALPVPVIAAVQGAAYGGGLQLALGACIRYLAPDARLSVMEVKWGLVPDMGGVAVLRGLLRDDVLRELAYSARVVDAQEAVQLGLATRCMEDPLAQARELAAQLAQRSPDALRAAKRLFNQALAGSDEAVLLQCESDEQVALMGAPNQVEAVRANLEKRAPQFR